MTAPGKRLAVRAAAVGALAAVAVPAFLLLAGAGAERTVRASFASANNLVPGLEVKIAGVPVGSVGSVEPAEGRAQVELEIADERAWPLPAETKAALRFGTTVGDAVRFVQLLPGPQGGEPIPEGGVIAAVDTTSPVEFDELFGAFDAPARRHLRGTLTELGATFGERGRALRAAVREGGPGMDAMARVLAELGADNDALRRLVRDGSRAVRVLADRGASVERVVAGGAETFAAFAARETELAEAIGGAPGALREAASTLDRARAGAGPVRALLTDLAPGARRLPALGEVAAGALRALDEVAPPLGATLDDATRTTPALRRLLRAGTRSAPPLERATRELVPALSCIRPYVPEIVGFISTWTGMAMSYDGLDHIARIHAVASPTAINGNPLTPAEFLSLFPNVKSALPRPPGLAAGDPWFLPRCGAGPAALDPEQDPETVRP